MPIFRLPTGEAPPTWKCVQLLGQIQFQYSRLKDCNTPASKCSSILTLALTSPASNALYGPLLLPQVKPSFIATKVVLILSLLVISVDLWNTIYMCVVTDFITSLIFQSTARIIILFQAAVVLESFRGLSKFDFYARSTIASKIFFRTQGRI